MAAAVVARRAKIICTLGPASNSEDQIRELLKAGMDVARLNFSHGTQAEHAVVIERLRKIAADEGRTVAILQDLQGPKIRTGRLKNGVSVELKPGQKLTIVAADTPGDASTISTSFEGLPKEVRPGERILLSDGLIELRVTAVKNNAVECDVINGGLLKEHQGINLPGTAVGLPSLTEKDLDDLSFGLKQGVDLIAVSFVRTAEDVLQAKEQIMKHGSNVPVIAKLEKPQAIEHLEAILQAADGVMVARGDLGVELPPEKVPIVQKQIIRRAADWRKPVITATQMLESMIENPRPTRAEASDVANAIFDGTDAVMLSGETAVGKYPCESVKMMARIVAEAEHATVQVRQIKRRAERQPLSIPETICDSVAHAAEELDMKSIAVFTETGNTARLISKYRPRTPVFAFTHIQAVCNRLNLLWGIQPVLWGPATSGAQMVQGAEQELRRMGKVKTGDVIGVVAGTQQTSGSTNFMRLLVVSGPS